MATTEYSELQLSRLQYAPAAPAALSAPRELSTAVGESTVARSSTDDAALRSWFPATYPQPLVNLVRDAAAAGAAAGKPVRIGVVFCGRQCPGAHNVVTGAWMRRRGGAACVTAGLHERCGVASPDACW
jgi:pyrophosphate--fructose-6-phosphate 1-phosphotransferase